MDEDSISQAEFNAILDSSFDGIHITDGNGVTLYYNKACERIEGLTKKEVIGKNVKKLVDAGIYSESVTLQALDKKKTVTMLQKINGKEVMVTATPIFKNGKITMVVANSRDITELNTLKQKLQYEKQAKQQFQSELEMIRFEQNNSDVIAQSSEMKKIIELVMHVATVDSTVLIQGESGVGKGVISKLIHDYSKRKDGPFTKIDCGVLPESLLESELFGYEKGAFTGATKEGKIGLIELASGGTLFLDEVGEMSPTLQMKLLRTIQDREIVRVGGREPIPVDIRIIAASNRDLETMVNENTFREDLFYRLNVVPIYIPPLRERKDDIFPLIIKKLEKFNSKYQLKKVIHPDVIDMLINYDWPGNVRELENIVERLVVTTSHDTITVDNVPNHIRRQYVEKSESFHLSGRDSYRKAMDTFERQLLLNVMNETSSIQEMAERLQIDPSTVRRKLKKHKLKC